MTYQMLYISSDFYFCPAEQRISTPFFSLSKPSTTLALGHAMFILRKSSPPFPNCSPADR